MLYLFLEFSTIVFSVISALTFVGFSLVSLFPAYDIGKKHILTYNDKKLMYLILTLLIVNLSYLYGHYLVLIDEVSILNTVISLLLIVTQFLICHVLFGRCINSYETVC